jgi:hypothetical protein
MFSLAVAWLLFGGGVYVATSQCLQAARISWSKGMRARALASLVLGCLGYLLAVVNLTTLSARCTGDYRTWSMHGGWYVAIGAVALSMAFPWLLWPRGRGTPEVRA